MNPGAVQLPATASASQFSPSYSPLYPPSVAHNQRVLSSLSTLSACFTGLVIGILGITNLLGFFLYLVFSALSAVLIAAVKCNFSIAKYVDQGPKGAQGFRGKVGMWAGLMGLGQEDMLGFLLFWIGGYALIHDLWDLTNDLRAATVADDLEKNFQARLPPSRRHDADPAPILVEEWKAQQDLDDPSQADVRPRTAFAQDPKTNRPRTFFGRRAVSGRKTVPKSIWGAELLAQAGDIGRMLSWVESDNYPALPGGKQDHRRSRMPLAVLACPEHDDEAVVSDVDDGLDEQFGRKKADKIRKGRLVYESGEWYDLSLWRAMYHTVKRRFWVATLIEAGGYGLQITAPLVTRLIIRQLTTASAYTRGQREGQPTEGLAMPPSVAYGVGLALGLFGMLWAAGLLLAQAEQRLFTIGFMLRSACIDAISRKSLRLSDRARLDMTNGHITNLVSSDASYLILIGIGLLIYTLGYSALVGLAVLATAAPLQSFFFARMLRYRQDQQSVVDQRVRLLSEVVGHIRAIKLYAYETHFEDAVNKLRKKELGKLKDNGLNRAAMTGVSYLIPMLAAILSFLTYSLTGHELDAAIIFSALQYFNILEMPISFLPMILTALSDAMSAIRRINDMLKAEEMSRLLDIDNTARYAIESKGDFAYDRRAAYSAERGETLDQRETTHVSQTPFSLRSIDLRVPKGALICVVGRVGTGKSALLSGLLGDLRQSGGRTVFGGSVSYVPQQAWVMAGSIRDNITFGAASPDVDLERLHRIVDACGLRPDLKRMTAGVNTMVGEKGVTLSGGQRQRLCLARAAYAQSDIVLMDDPLSAVDAQVGHHLLHHCILHGPLAGRTRVLVTHQLDILPRADWVVVLDAEGCVGRIAQQGRYANLIRQNGALREMVRESLALNRPLSSARPLTVLGAELSTNTDDPPVTTGIGETAHAELQEQEERETGAVSWKAYGGYIRAMGNPLWAIVILASLILGQVANVGNSLMLGFWSGQSIAGWGQGQYMGVYAGFGIAMAICISGRIISRLSKDVQMLDDRLAQVWNNFLTLALSIFGTLALVIYTYPWLGIVFVPLGIYMYLAAGFYRQTSREVKRIDSILRSAVYSKLDEQLSGMLVVRAFGKQANAIRGMQSALDSQGRALILSITLQQWLIVRLDFMSQLLILMIAVFGVVFRESVDPAKFGVVLTYALATTTTLTKLVPLFAYCEQEMNNVERVQHYLSLPSEPAAHLPTDPPADMWPTHGEIKFENVSMRYRTELPLAIKDLNLCIKAGESCGVIGRTAAGKSSITQALFRMADIEPGGRIVIDGRDIKSLGIETLRKGLSIIPQEALLFGGSVRNNLDPSRERTDRELNYALDRIRLLPDFGPSLREKFQLDSEVGDGGANFSAGERQLLALVRALVRKPKILILDEATSSVDSFTDALIQRVIQTEFRGTTILSIAHRLKTVAYFDRIMVMDKGEIVEFDTPSNLFARKGSLFRNLCDKQHLTHADILRLQRDAAQASRNQAATGKEVTTPRFPPRSRWLV